MNISNSPINVMLPNIKDMENGVFLIAITIHSTDISI